MMIMMMMIMILMMMTSTIFFDNLVLITYHQTYTITSQRENTLA